MIWNVKVFAPNITNFVIIELLEMQFIGAIFIKKGGKQACDVKNLQIDIICGLGKSFVHWNIDLLSMLSQDFHLKRNML